MTKQRLYLFDTTLRDGQQTTRLARRRSRGQANVKTRGWENE